MNRRISNGRRRSGRRPPPTTGSPRAFRRGPSLASWGLRLAAQLIDGLIAIAVTVGAATLAGLAGGVLASDGDVGFSAGVVTYFVAGVAWLLSYSPLTMRRPGARNGQTWGRQAVSTRVLREDGKPVTAGTAYFRDVLMKNIVFLWAGACFFYVPTFLDVFWPLWDDRNQTLHDKAADTLVVRT